VARYSKGKGVAGLIEKYRSGFLGPERLKDRDRRIGVELEFQVMDSNGYPAPVETTRMVFDEWRTKYGWERILLNGVYYGVRWGLICVVRAKPGQC
jgi:hypothetical protein